MSKFLKECDGFKVGDRVKVKNYYIAEFEGMVGTIYKIDSDYALNIDVVLDNFTSGHDGHAGDTSTNHRFFSTKDLELLSSTQHNVGDWVQVRSYLSTEKSYGGIYPSEQMLHKVGQKVRIKAVTKTGRYKIEGSCFTWTNEMFEDNVDQKVEKNKKREPKVGDRIRMTTDFCNARTGMTGVIKYALIADFAVEFDQDFLGHDCCGKTKIGRGHWVRADHFEIIDTPKYSIATVTFDNDKEYCYLCDISVKKGDKVVVPCGSCDRETIATVVKTGKYTEENAPYPVDKMKKVIRKGTDTKPTKKVDTKPTPKIEAGDVVRAIDDFYGITTLRNEWEGVVIATDFNGFTALTTHSKSEQMASYTKFCGLNPKHFEIIKKNT